MLLLLKGETRGVLPVLSDWDRNFDRLFGNRSERKGLDFLCLSAVSVVNLLCLLPL